MNIGRTPSRPIGQTTTRPAAASSRSSASVGIARSLAHRSVVRSRRERSSAAVTLPVMATTGSGCGVRGRLGGGSPLWLRRGLQLAVDTLGVAGGWELRLTQGDANRVGDRTRRRESRSTRCRSLRATVVDERQQRARVGWRIVLGRRWRSMVTTATAYESTRFLSGYYGFQIVCGWAIAPTTASIDANIQADRRPRTRARA